MTIIHINKAVIYLLQKEYDKEFEIIDGLNQHPDGLSFEAWLVDRDLDGFDGDGPVYHLV